MLSEERLNEIRQFNKLASSYHVRDLLEGYDELIEDRNDTKDTLKFMAKQWENEIRRADACDDNAKKLSNKLLQLETSNVNLVTILIAMVLFLVAAIIIVSSFLI